MSSPATGAPADVPSANQPGKGGHWDLPMSKPCAYYSVLFPENGVLHHTVLPKVGIMLVKAIMWPLKLTLRWVMPESHNCKDLHSLGGWSGGPRPTLQLAVMQNKISVSHWAQVPLLGARAVLKPRLWAMTCNNCLAWACGMGGRSHHSWL